MKVSELIAILSKMNPDAEVEQWEECFFDGTLKFPLEANDVKYISEDKVLINGSSYLINTTYDPK